MIIFDCNGVLVDSEPIATAVVAQEFHRAGFGISPEVIARYASDAALEVDGGISRDTIRDVWRAGADTFVAGNAVFTAKDPKAEIAFLRKLCLEQA